MKLFRTKKFIREFIYSFIYEKLINLKLIPLFVIKKFIQKKSDHFKKKKNKFIMKIIHQLIRYFVLLILIQNIQCTVPTIHYSHNMRILKLPKTTPIGSLIYRLRASAAQDLQLKFVIANGTDVNLITIKSVDFYQANVYLNKQLQVKCSI